MKKLCDFKCNKCGHVFEKLTDKTVYEVCPQCGNNDTTSFLSPVSFKVSGQGAYSNKMKV